jgi:hypothetical protein
MTTKKQWVGLGRRCLRACLRLPAALVAPLLALTQNTSYTARTNITQSVFARKAVEITTNTGFAGASEIDNEQKTMGEGRVALIVRVKYTSCTARAQITQSAFARAEAERQACTGG